jgi:chromosome segregation ATPase
MYFQEQLSKWEDYEDTKLQLLRASDKASERLIQLSQGSSRIAAQPVTVAESIREQLTSTRELLATVEAQQSEINRLYSLGDALGDMASEARQDALRSELAAITDRNESLSSDLTSRITRLEALDRSWAYLTTQSSELSTLLAEKKEELNRAVQDTNLTPDQQYEIVKVNYQLSFPNLINCDPHAIF